MKCPYCKDFSFNFMTYEQVHEHTIICSKEYLDKHLFQYYAKPGSIKWVEDVYVVRERRSNNSTRRARIGDRRIKNQTLYFYTNVPTGKYLDKDGFMLPDRRNRKSRRFLGTRRRKL